MNFILLSIDLNIVLSSNFIDLFEKIDVNKVKNLY